MKKLLTQSLKPLIIYALVILVLSIPVYFISIDITWKQELDKHHNAIKFKIESRLNQLDMSEVERAKAIEILNTMLSDSMTLFKSANSFEDWSPIFK